MKKIKVYLDTCIISAIASIDRITDKDAEELGKISELSFIDFVTSFRALQELDKTPNEKRRNLFKVFYKLLEKVPLVNHTHTVGAPYGASLYGESMYGGTRKAEKELFKKLRNIFDMFDAVHIFQAANSNCDYFLTLDKNTILAPAKRNKQLLDKIIPNIKFVNPVDLYKKLKK